MTDAWVVFDGCEPDSEVLGVTHSVEGIWRIIDETVERLEHSGVMKFIYSDVIRAEAAVRKLYSAKRAYNGAWLAKRFSVD